MLCDLNLARVPRIGISASIQTAPSVYRTGCVLNRTGRETAQRNLYQVMERIERSEGVNVRSNRNLVTVIKRDTVHQVAAQISFPFDSRRDRRLIER